MKPPEERSRHPGTAASFRVASAAHATKLPDDARPEQDLDLDARSGQHVDERIETEEVDSGAHEVADPRPRLP